jgi:hypothetical protein
VLEFPSWGIWDLRRNPIYKFGTYTGFGQREEEEAELLKSNALILQELVVSAWFWKRSLHICRQYASLEIPDHLD